MPRFLTPTRNCKPSSTNDARVNFAIGRAVAYNDAADFVQALLSGARA